MELEVSISLTITGDDEERAVKVAALEAAIEKLENDGMIQNPEYEYASEEPAE